MSATLPIIVQAMSGEGGWDSGLKALRPWTIAKAVIAYVLFLAPLLIIALDFLSRKRPMNREELQAVIVILNVSLVCFLLFQPWRRALWDLRKASRWKLGVWRDAKFASNLTRDAELTKRAASFDTESLLASCKWPDHTASATAAIRQELHSRGLSDEAIDSWLPPPAHITVPPIAGTTLGAQWQPMEMLVFILARVLGFAGLVALIGVFLFTVWGVSSRASAGAGASGALTSLAALIGSWGFLIVFVIPLGTLISMQTRSRILLLRPFDQRAMTKTLKLVVLRYIGSSGHVFTLSDIHYRPNPFIRLGDVIMTGCRYAVAVMARPSIRIATVKNARTYLALAARLGGRVKPAFRHFVSGGQAYNIKSTNRWWQWCIDLLMHSSNAVVMDISRVSTGSAWEIDHMQVRDMLAKTIFIAQEEYEAHASETLQRILGNIQLPPVFLYNAAGELKEPVAFREALATALQRLLHQAPQHAAAPQMLTIERLAEATPQPLVALQPGAIQPAATIERRADATPLAAAAAGMIMGLPRMAMTSIAAVTIVAAILGWLMFRGNCADAEADWKSIQMLHYGIRTFEEHLSRFPSCPSTILAKERIEALKVCEAFEAERSRLEQAITQEEFAGSPSLFSRTPPDSPQFCGYMERAVQYSDELNRLTAEKGQKCAPRPSGFPEAGSSARSHVQMYCRGTRVR